MFKDRGPHLRDTYEGKGTLYLIREKHTPSHRWQLLDASLCISFILNGINTLGSLYKI